MTGIDRRKFVKTLGAGTAGVALGCARHSMIGGAKSRKIDRVGIQLYTVRNDMERDFEGTLAR
ncbi:MAG: twin-arginine translocation signal domain-containing protein, partial [Gemmatimonadaceae bacterium]